MKPTGSSWHTSGDKNFGNNRLAIGKAYSSRTKRKYYPSFASCLHFLNLSVDFFAASTSSRTLEQGFPASLSLATWLGIYTIQITCHPNVNSNPWIPPSLEICPNMNDMACKTTPCLLVTRKLKLRHVIHNYCHRICHLRPQGCVPCSTL